MNKRTVFIIVTAILAVSVVGAFWVWKKQEEISDTQALSKQKILKDNDLKEVDTSNWKTYQNEKYGFEVRYPQNLVMIDNSSTDHESSINFHEENKSGALLFSVYSKDHQVQSLEEKERINKEIFNEEVVMERFIFKGFPALRIKIKGNPQAPSMDQIYFIRNNTEFGLSFSIGGVPNISEYENEILSTFRFIE